ncbi:MAG: urea ABC transporter ATP-binding subunit UrtE [Pseudomonadota bacterium]
MLRVRSLNQYYGQSHVLRDVDFEVKEAEIHCLMGRNGVGKTTLVKSLLALVPAQADELRLGARDLREERVEARVDLGMGYVPQGRMIFPDLTVGENLELALRPRALATVPTPGPDLSLVYEFFPVLNEMRERRGGDLSGGQQQQLAIGRALLTQPRLLILDEPCEGIQPNIVSLIGSVLERLRDDMQMSILLIEQKLPFARRYADRFSLMDRGQIVVGGPIAELNDQLVDEYLTV